MRNIFTWFYCLPILDALGLMLLATAVFLRLKERFGEKEIWKPAICGLIVLWLIAVVYITVMRRNATVEQEAAWIPFRSYYLAFCGVNVELLRSSLMNVLLFYPAGLLMGVVLPKSWKLLKRVLLTAAVGCAVSLCVECAQYFGHLGLAETDDVIHNAFGVLLGAAASGVSLDFKRHRV